MKQVMFVMVIMFTLLSLSAQLFPGFIDVRGAHFTYYYPTPPGVDYIALDGGVFHCVALRADSVIVAWGSNTWGQSDAPAGSDYIAVTAGGYHNLALKADGSLVAWGNNDWGQCDVPSGNDYIAIAAGEYHSLALKADSTLVAWGDNRWGQGDIPSGYKFRAMAGGNKHSLALVADGSLLAWGENTDGQCDVPAGNNYTAVAAGGWHSLALKSDRSLVAWGSNYQGMNEVPAGNIFIAIAAGCYHNLALRVDHSIIQWGSSLENQAAPMDYYSCYWAIAAGWNHSLALRETWYPPPELSPFTATMAWNNSVELCWVTESETLYLGFNIYRSETYAWEDAIQINTHIIPATNTSYQHTYILRDANVLPEQTYYYWLVEVQSDGGLSVHGPVYIIIPEAATPPLPEASLLGQAYPNPVYAGASARMDISIKAGERGEVTLYNLRGQAIKVYHFEAGNHILSWDSAGYSSGVYFYRLVTPTVKATGKLVVVK